ncbi:hypothetical protein LXL04_007863 [Taraxacum kok-saghyz]
MTQEHASDPPQNQSSSSFPINLKFIDICYRVKIENSSSNSLITSWFGGTETCSTAHSRIQERTILNGITGMVHPGELLAVLGPSGSGKSTLLNALGGRLPVHQFTGTVLANGRKLSKTVLRRTGFVTQDDVLYPHLTVRETLVFCALLRLPKSLTRQEKTAVADSVISELGLSKCENTIIGNTFIRGVSGGERKRVSIAHEMLVNPSLLILDEPTSGLDSTAAYMLVSTLAGLAHQKGKTVITSVHQPSSRVFQMFDTVLVLSEGRCIYFGKASEAMVYFESLNFRPSFPMNPADFLLDLANGRESNITLKECVTNMIEMIAENNSYIPENPRTPKPLTFSKNRLREAFLKQNKKMCTYAKKIFLHICKVFEKKIVFSEKKILRPALYLSDF